MRLPPNSFAPCEHRERNITWSVFGFLLQSLPGSGSDLTATSICVGSTVHVLTEEESRERDYVGTVLDPASLAEGKALYKAAVVSGSLARYSEDEQAPAVLVTSASRADSLACTELQRCEGPHLEQHFMRECAPNERMGMGDGGDCHF